jgi:hypothetical protein
MSTITTEQQEAIAAFLNDRHIPAGLGTEEEACSIAAINLALTGTLNDTVPDCMSEVIGRWIIGAQDAMPDEMRNSAEWRELLPLAAGTGRENEKERLDIILDWMWGTVLPSLQPLADEKGFGPQWSAMCTERTSEAARSAASAAYAYSYAYAAAAYAAAYSYAYAATDTAYAAYAASAADTAYSAYAAAVAAANAADWRTFDPIGLLRRLVAS